MAQKDLMEKLLEDYEDVFADIVNVLLFQGKAQIQADSLEDASGRTFSANSGCTGIIFPTREPSGMWMPC